MGDRAVIRHPLGLGQILPSQGFHLLLVTPDIGLAVEGEPLAGCANSQALPCLIGEIVLRKGLGGVVLVLPVENSDGVKQIANTDLVDGDLKHHTDFRQVYAALLQNWLGYPAEPVLGKGFQPVDCVKG